jgi:voltage-gated potassium channel
MSRLVIPAFAFFTFYSLIVILFASAYRLISVYAPAGNFSVGGALRGLSFSESIYFSIGTISTVGYGDIIPYSNFARLLSSLEVFCGIMLLLFGVSELLGYAREHRQDQRSE